MGESGLSPHAAALIADRVEASAFADLYAAAPTALKTDLGVAVATVADATLLLAPRVPTPVFNRAIGLGMSSPASLGTVQAIVDAYKVAGVASWWLHWSPFAHPADFESALLQRGFTHAKRLTWAKMLLAPAPLPAVTTDLRIDAAGDDRVDDVVTAIAQAFEMPPFMAQWLRQLHGRPRWRIYALSDGPRVVGGGCLFVEGAAAWLGMGSVLPSHRGRGGQRALMSRRIADAIAAGATRIVTETGEAIGDEPNPSLANMARCGFERVASRVNLVGPAA